MKLISRHQTERALIDWLTRIQTWRGYVSPVDLATLNESIDFMLAGPDTGNNDDTHTRVCVGLPCALAGANDLWDASAAIAARNGTRIVRETCLHHCWLAPVAICNSRSCANPSESQDELCRYLSSGGYSVLKSCVSRRRSSESIIYSLSSRSFASLEKTATALGTRIRQARTSGTDVTLLLLLDEFRPTQMSQTYFIERYIHHVLEGLFICAFALDAKEVLVHCADRHLALRNVIERAVATIYEYGIEYTPRVIFTGASSDRNSDLLSAITKWHPKQPLSSVFIVGPEILSFIPEMLAKGADAYENTNVCGITLPTLYSILGSVAEPGIYKGLIGATVDELVGIAGGISKSNVFKGFIAGAWDNPAFPARFSTLQIDAASIHQFSQIAFPLVILSGDDSIERSYAFGGMPK
jgi:NADH:ubiquinone oxidoreductase subunit E